ncbi:HrgA protein [Helicobacter felis ATCC 49179]|uniref:HrgA protein n=2 Tax=Helicobacter felis TaxID=214 RepID=E7AB99_HELFC|nr:HrgA protein [Helicobacter felis ATCC 49179]
MFHKKTLKSKHGKNSWLYPDMVGASFAYKNFDPQSLFEELKCNLLS